MTPVEVKLLQIQAISARVSDDSYQSTIRPSDKKAGAHQKNTAQNICTTFLLNDISEARTIGVAGSKQE
jgi:hypothetical protein